MENQNNRETFKLEYLEADEIVCGDSEEYDTINKSFVDKGRWTTTFKHIVKRKSDGKYFKFYISEGSTEYQDSGDYNKYVKFEEVFPVEKTITVYE